MKVRIFRRTSFIVRGAADIRRAAWRVLIPWIMPRIEIRSDDFPPLEAQRSQIRLRRLDELMARRTGALLAIGVLIVGLADMVRTWNRSLEHMAFLVGLAIAVGLAGRIVGKAWVRLRVLFELARLRYQVRKAAERRQAADPPPVAQVASRHDSPIAPSAVFQPAAKKTLKGSCGCGTVTFTLSSPPSIMGTCHCIRCRKTGAGTFVIVKRDAFRLTSGADAVVTCQPEAPHQDNRSFCARCGSALGEVTSTSATFQVAANCLDDELGISNGYHEFVSQKPGWYSICDGARQFPGPPPG